MSRLALVTLVVVAACGRVQPPAVECTAASECTDPAAPFCIDQHCEAKCAGDTDCTDSSRPVCASDGVCVGCEAAGDCSAAAPICDDASRACRGCARDAECPGGICVEADGVCVADAEVAFVTMMGTDTGTCTRAAPCATLAFALAQAGTRRVLHVLGGTLFTPTFTIASGTGRVLDGEDTSLNAGNTTALKLQGPAEVTVEGFRLTTPNVGSGTPLPAIEVTGLAHVRLFDLRIEGMGGPAVTASTGAEVAITRSHIGSLSSTSANLVTCSSAKLTVDQCVLETTILGGFQTTCELTVTRNRFESSNDGSVQISDGQLIMENNLVIHRDGFNDSISVGGLRPGSTIRFNTLVNTTAVSSDGAALSCDGSVVVTSNVFAYNSGHPITGTGCETRYSVFDDKATTAAGTGNQVTGIDQIFQNRGAGDYHLAAASVARAGAEPGLNMVTIDFDGKPRPAPVGTIADSGAFEAP